MKIAHEWIFFQGKLRQLCEQYDIGIIYAQSSGCVLWGSAIVASLTSKPLLHTLHGHSALYESDNEHWSSFIYKFILAEHISCVYSMSEILGWMANCFGNVVVMPNVVDVGFDNLQKTALILVCHKHSRCMLDTLNYLFQ